MRSVATLLLTGAVAAGCAGADDPAAAPPAGACAEPQRSVSTARLPAGLALDAFGTFTEVVREGGYLNATSVTEGTLEELDAQTSAGLEEAGYSIVGSENEVIEADIFFARGRDVTGGVKFVKQQCPGRVTVHLFLSEG